MGWLWGGPQIGGVVVEMGMSVCPLSPPLALLGGGGVSPSAAVTPVWLSPILGTTPWPQGGGFLGWWWQPGTLLIPPHSRREKHLTLETNHLLGGGGARGAGPPAARPSCFGLVSSCSPPSVVRPLPQPCLGFFSVRPTPAHALSIWFSVEYFVRCYRCSSLYK